MLEPSIRSTALRRARLPFRAGIPLMGGLTIARGPIGYGKTTLLRQWLDDARAAGHGVCWQSLGAEHRTVEAFVRDVLPPGTMSAADRLVNWLCDENARATMLFLDNWDAVIGSETEALLADMLDSGRLRASLFIAGRRACGLPLEAALAHDSLRIIDQNALKLSETEQQRLMGTRLWQSQPSQLLDACDGWPLALKLLKSMEAMECARTFDAALFIRQTGLEAIVVRQLEAACSPDEAALLALLGFCAEVDVTLLNRVRDASDSAMLLDGIASLLPFVVTSKGRGLRYRPAELVRPLLLRYFEASARDWQQRIACRLFDENHRSGRTLDAISCALLAGETEKALQLLEAVGPLRLMMIYGIHPVQEVLRQFPPDLLEHSLRSRLAFSFLYAKRGHYAEAREMIDAIQRELDSLRDDDATKSAALPDAIFVKTKISACVDQEWIDDRAVAARTKSWKEPAFAAAAIIFSGMTNQHLGQLDQADADFEEAEILFKQINADYQLLHMKVHRTHVALARGNLRQAARMMREIKSSIKAHYPSDIGLYAAAELGRIEASLLQSHASVELDALYRALDNLEHADSWFELLAIAYTSLCRCIMRDQDISALMAGLDNVERTARRHGTRHIGGMIRALRAFYLTREGRFDEAERCIGDRDWKANRDNSEFWRERHMLGLAHSRLAAAQERMPQALAIAEALVRESRTDGRQPAAVEASLNHAELLFPLTGREAEALDELVQAIELAGRIGAFGSLHPWRELIGRHRPAVRNAIDSRLKEPFDRLCDEWQGRVGSDLLSSREITVLQGVARGLTNKQISRELTVSENTVKFHLKQCFRKLNSQHRDDAVRQALNAKLI